MPLAVRSRINGSNVEFTPDADFNGSASFDYTRSDDGLIHTGSVSFAVTEVYDPPPLEPEINIIRDDPTTDTILSNSRCVSAQVSSITFTQLYPLLCAGSEPAARTSCSSCAFAAPACRSRTNLIGSSFPSQVGRNR